MALVSDQEVPKIWRKYHRQPTSELRNQLMVAYLPIVKFNAERVGAKLPDEVDTDDLMSAGIFGLMDAIDSFDPRRGVKFETYCAPRVRGAMLDELRSMDWVPRLVRSRANKLDAATRALEVELGRVPTHEELARRMGLNDAEFEKLFRDATAVGVVSLSRKYYETDSSRDVREIDILEDQNSIDAEEESLKRDLKEFIQNHLTRIEQLILVLYYYEEMTMKEIGRTLDLSESRVSQMHSAIISRLRKVLPENCEAGCLERVLA